MRGRLALAAAGAFLLSGTATAQSKPPLPIDRDLQCAIWAAVAGGQFEQGAERASYDAVFTYFMGKFEGRTGEPVENAMTPELIASEADDWAFLTALCQPQALELGERLIEFGTSLQEAGGGANETSPPEEPVTSAP